MALAGALFSLGYGEVSLNRRVYEAEEDIMERNTCEICGYQSQLGAIEIHHIIPTEVTEEAGMQRSQTVVLCCNCHREVHTWYSAKVTDTAYDTASQRFKDKSSLEIVKAYQHAFDSFAKYKNEQKKSTEK